MKNHVLIFYISRYSGHYNAAVAIEKGLKQIDGGTIVRKIDIFDQTNPIIGKLVNKAYLKVLDKNPELWGRMYDNPDVMKTVNKARDAFHKINMRKIGKLFDKFEPDAVFCTQAYPCGMIAQYKKIKGKNIPLIGVLTDYAPHSYWLFDEVDYYVVPSDETAHVFESKGIAPEKIKLYGIPVDPDFSMKQDKKPMRENINIEEKDPTILIMGGNQGLGEVEEAVRSLGGDTRHNYQLLVVTGTNKKLYSSILKLSRDFPDKKIRVFAYVENISELMEVSDIIVTKAGGLTIAEAMVKGLPIIIVSPIPGQERMNSDHLVKMRVAVEVDNCNGIREKVSDLFDSKSTLDDMKMNIAKLARPDSALDIARLALVGF